MAEVRRSISDLSDSVHTLESATESMLDAVRNELIAFEIKIYIVTIGVGLGALIAGSTTWLRTGVGAFALMRLFRYGKIRLHRSQRHVHFFECNCGKDNRIRTSTHIFIDHICLYSVQ